MSVLVLNEADLRACVGFDVDSLECVQGAFGALAGGGVSMPPVMHIEVPDPRGDIDVKGAFIPGVDLVAIKIASGFFLNPKRGLPSSSAMMVGLSAETGLCEAVFLDNGYLTDLRTGLAGAVAARWLANPGPLRVGVIGAGAQARYQVWSLAIEQRIGALTIYARQPEQAAAYAAEMEKSLGLAVNIAASLSALAAASDLIITTTPSTAPFLEAQWLRPGHHITAMGSDLPGKAEIGAAALRKADVLVGDHPAQNDRIGEWRQLDAAETARLNAIALGDIITGRKPGRRSADEITICDLTGVGAQDTAIAHLALSRARARGLGTVL